MKKETRARHLHNRTIFCSINSLTSLCKLLKTDKNHLNLLIQQPRYKTFSVPKKEGGQRLIEDPGLELKKILSRLNYYLQSVYLFEKSSAAYGFIVGIQNDDDRRNVLTNAKKHVGKKYLLNIDLKDFFHQVTLKKVAEIFAGKPFKFRGDLPELLADLCTYQGRLPMGAPTSPVLSNLACRELDAKLAHMSGNLLWAYTRYADDLTFSANTPFSAEKLNTIRPVIKQYDFEINERKTKIFGLKDEKIVTGLLVTDKVSLAPDFLPILEAEIQKLHDVFRIQNEQGRLSTKWVEQFKQQVRGRLNFAGFVMGRHLPDYQNLKDKFYVAVNPPEEEFGRVTWLGFPYL